MTGSVSSLSKLPSKPRSLQAVYEESLYSCDEQVRYSQPLLETDDYKKQSSVSMNSEQAEKENLTDAETVKVTMDDSNAEFTFNIDEGVPSGCVLIPHGISASDGVLNLYGAVSVEAV